MNLIRFLSFLLFICFSLVGCDKALEAVYPMPQIVAHDTQNNFFGLGTNECRITIQNTGASGDIYIRLQSQSQRIEESLYFNKGERRTVIIRLPDSFTGAFDVNVIAAGLKDVLDKEKAPKG